MERELWSEEQQWIESAKEAAKKAGREVLTPKAVQELYDKTEPAVSAARRRGRLAVAWELRATDKSVPVFSLASAVELWGPADPVKLQKLRDNAMPLWVSNANGRGGMTWNILHTGPLVAVLDPGGLE